MRTTRSWIAPVLVVLLCSWLWAQRVSPKSGYFSLEGPTNWQFTPLNDVLLWSSPDARAQFTASALNETGGTFADDVELLKSRGMEVLRSDERLFHGFRCLFVYGAYASSGQHEQDYFCYASRRGNPRWTIWISASVDARYEASFGQITDKFFDSLLWDKDVKDAH